MRNMGRVHSQCGTVGVTQIHSKTMVEQREVRNVCDNLQVQACCCKQPPTAILNMGGWQQLKMCVMKLTERVQRLRQCQR